MEAGNSDQNITTFAVFEIVYDFDAHYTDLVGFLGSADVAIYDEVLSLQSQHQQFFILPSRSKTGTKLTIFF